MCTLVALFNTACRIKRPFTRVALMDKDRSGSCIPKRLIILAATLLIIFSFVFTPLPVTGAGETRGPQKFYPDPAVLPGNTSGNGEQERLLSVQMPGQLSFTVVEQPLDNPTFVSVQPRTVTRFQLADRYGTIGLLAHNTHSGAAFNQLNIGDRIILRYKNQRYVEYQVQSIKKFQALSPNSAHSTFIDLGDGTRYSASELFMNMYGADNQLVFQTCLARNGLNNWGRLFVTAKQTSNRLPPDHLLYGQGQGPAQIFSPVGLQ